MSTPLWNPSQETVDNSNMFAFINKVNARNKKNFSSYQELYNWSVNSIPDFWSSLWEYTQPIVSQTYEFIVDDPTKMPGAKWFHGARLNFAENLLKYRDSRIALIFRGETEIRKQVSYAELYDLVARIAKSLKDIGVKPNDRIVAYMPNMIETIAAMLAATSIGAIWASCATEVGLEAATDRLSQIKPKVLFTVDGYYYKGKRFDSLAKATGLARRIPSLEKVVVTTYGKSKPELSNTENFVHFNDFISPDKDLNISFNQLPFDHPLYIMFSSGTTGKPKCMVQGAGGILINHLKELILHTDLKREDTLFYITTCSWMMWNWMVSSLAVGNTLVLYDGNPNYPDTSAMWNLIEDEKVTVFGCSASYLNYLKSVDIKPGKNHDLSSLREISQTGSILSAEGFEYVYDHIKDTLWFNSISGGTDINGCFCAGNPISPVYSGELQGPALGMKIKVYDDTGKAVADKKGELVCESSSPSMPLYFWNDPDNNKYKQAYFEIYPGVWRHGDYVQLNSDTGGYTFFGRSDSVLQPSGVRIGTAEIYNQLEKMNQIADSLAIGQNWWGDQRVILFIKCSAGYSLTDELKNEIKVSLRENVSPRHVPALIFEMPEIPYTLSMKKVESAVTNLVNGLPVTNKDALINPNCLDHYEKILPELEK